MNAQLKNTTTATIGQQIFGQLRQVLGPKHPEMQKLAKLLDAVQPRAIYAVFNGILRIPNKTNLALFDAMPEATPRRRNQVATGIKKHVIETSWKDALSPQVNSLYAELLEFDAEIKSHIKNGGNDWYAPWGMMVASLLVGLNPNQPDHIRAASGMLDAFAMFMEKTSKADQQVIANEVAKQLRMAANWGVVHDRSLANACKAVNDMTVEIRLRNAEMVAAKPTEVTPEIQAQLYAGLEEALAELKPQPTGLTFETAFAAELGDPNAQVAVYLAEMRDPYAPSQDSVKRINPSIASQNEEKLEIPAFLRRQAA